MARPARRSYGPAKRTRKQCEAALAALLLNCRDEALARHTAEGLSRSSGVPVARCAVMLAAERRERPLRGK